MILSIKSYINTFIENGYIKNVNVREISNSEGVGLDLTFNEAYEINDSLSFLGDKYRKTPVSTLLPFDKDNIVYLKPNHNYLLKTKEEFDLPSEICCQFFPRSTLFRSGVIFQSSILSTGYVGPMIFSLINNNGNDFAIEKGARFATAIFNLVDGDVNEYKGQWNGGRVYQPKSERQI